MLYPEYSFDFLFKNHPLPMWIYDLQTLSFLEVNDAAVEKYGYSKKKFLSMTIKDIRPEEDIPKLIKNVKKKRPTLQHSGVWRHKLKNGNIIYVDITSHQIIYKGRNAVLVIAKDVTKEIMIKEKVEKLNRLYLVLSDVNQTIVRVREKEKLLKSISKIVKTEEGLLNWIGLIDDNKINIISSAGFSKQFIEKQKKLFNEKSFKQIINKLIRSKQHLVFNDSNKESHYWQVYKNYGINSFLLFPIKSSKNVIGILALFTNQQKNFDEDEVKLFREMALDISFAIDFIEKENERKKAEEIIKLNEELYRTLFETSPVGIILEDVEGKIIDVNKKFCQITGYSREELLRLNVREFQTKNKIDHVEENIKKILEGELLDIEVTSLRKDKKPIWVHLTERKVKLPDGRIAILSIAEDISDKKKAEELLRESEERFRSLYENSTIGLYRTTPDGKILLANKTLIEMLGYSSFEELSKRNLKKEGFEPSYERQIFIEKIEKEGIIKGLESAWKRKDGTTVFVRESARAIRDANGKTLYYDGTVEDITERKIIEDKLRDSEEKYRSLIESSDDPIFLIDKNYKYLYANHKYLDRLKIKLDDLIEKKYSDLHSEESTNQFIKYAGKVFFSAQPFTYEYKSYHDNNYFLRTLSPVKDPHSNKVKAITVFSKNITKRVLAENALKESEELFRRLADTTNTAIFIYKESKFVYVNKAAQRISGYSEDEFLNMNFWDIVHPDYRELIKQRGLARMRSENVPSSYEFKIISKDGKEIWLNFTATMIEYKGEFAALGTAYDVTETKRILNELIEAKENAERANRLKDAFIANISHEIRTPLNGILGMVSLIRDTFEKYITEEEEEFFAGIDNSSRRIIRTIDMILNYSRLQVGEFPVHYKENDLSLICNNLVLEFQSAAKVKSLELTFENHCGNVPIIVDEYSITQAISNLIDNAIKYTKKGYVKVKLYKNSKNETAVDVQDSGIGISKDYLDYIFEPYRQEEMGYGRAYDGIGLGLALVKKFLDMNNAKIKVKSVKGEGTTFTINFGNMPIN